MTLRSKQVAILATTLCSLAASASAQNSSHFPADLVLHFQNPGGPTGSDKVLIATLGSVNLLRDAAPGSFTLISTAPALGSTLLSTFGANWFEAPTLFAGAVTNRNTDPTTSALLTFDPSRTLYVTRARNTAGTVGLANSNNFTVAPDGNMTAAATQIASVKTNIESRAGANPIVVLATGNDNAVDDNNPFVTPGNQGPAYDNTIVGGVQDNFAAGSFGPFGIAGSVELALDLYRVQARNDINGQYGFGEATNVGDFLGTLTIDSGGQVGFTAAVPEPSAAMLGLAAVGVLGMVRRRRA